MRQAYDDAVHRKSILFSVSVCAGRRVLDLIAMVRGTEETSLVCVPQCAQRPLDTMAPHTAMEKGLQLRGGRWGGSKGFYRGKTESQKSQVV